MAMAPNSRRVLSLFMLLMVIIICMLTLVSNGIPGKTFISHNKCKSSILCLIFHSLYSPPIPTMITAQIAVMPNNFVDSVNDVTLTKYPFQGSLVPDI